MSAPRGNEVFELFPNFVFWRLWLGELAHNLGLPALRHRSIASEGGQDLFVAQILRPGLELLWGLANPLAGLG
jgi:hypothetical protein